MPDRRFDGLVGGLADVLDRLRAALAPAEARVVRTVVSLARRAVVFELALYRSLLRWVTRRPDVQPGGVGFGYVGAVALLLWVFIGVSAVELVVVHVLLPWETVRLVADVLGIWGLVWMLGLAASYSVLPARRDGVRPADQAGPRHRPHGAVGGRRQRRRAGAQPRHVEGAPGRPRREQAVVLNVVMGSRTDVDVRLRRPMLVPVRGGEESVTEIRLYADEPARPGAPRRVSTWRPAAQPRRSST